jgi:hypothetical protein
LKSFSASRRLKGCTDQSVKRPLELLRSEPPILLNEAVMFSGLA